MSRLSEKGFTLVELVLVMIILGIVSAGVGGFITSGAKLFVDVTERDQILSESRFVVERLNRDIRQALPNSVRISGNASVHCLEYVPVVWSSFYLDIPVAPDPASDEFTAIVWGSADPYVHDSSHQVVVYPTSTSEVYGSAQKRFALPNPPTTSGNVATFELASPVQFAADSPSSRVYVVDLPISYCISAGQILRYQGYGFLSTQSTNSADLGSPVLMADNVVNTLSASAGSVLTDPFRVSEAGLTRNAIVLNLLQFENNGEQVTFNNEVHLPNVP